jgi:hypothetical protein
MALAWIAVLVAVVGFSAMYRGRNCKVPGNGPLHSLLAGHKFVPSHSWRSGGCLELK